MKPEEIEIARWAIEEAQKAGVRAARAELLNFDGISIQTEGTQIASLQQSRSHGMTLTLFVDDRYGTFSTNSLDKESIRQLIRVGIASTRLLSPDPDWSLPDPKRCYRANSTEQALQEALALGNYKADYQAHAPKPTDMAVSIAKRIEGADKRIINICANLGGRSGWQYMVDSQQFEGFSFCSNCYAYTSVSLHDTDGSRPSDGWVDYSLDFASLHGVIDRHASLALEAAQHKIGAHPLKAGRYNIAIEPVCIMKMLEPVVEAMYGGSLYKHNSFLEGKLGEQLFSPLFNLSERPQRHGAYGATLFGSDGVRAVDYDLIRNGRVCTWLIGTYYSRKLHCEPTNNTTSVLCLGTGRRSRQQIMAEEKEVLLITGFLGGNCNEVTGDFSFGIEGQLYRDGERIHGVSGTNLTGNLIDFWKQLAETSSDTEKIMDGYFPLTLFRDIELN